MREARYVMIANSIRRGLWCALFAASTALGLAACGGTDEPIDDEEAVTNDGSGDSVATEEETAEVSQALCEGWDKGARNCTVKCWSHANWNNLGPKPYGTCTDAGYAYCAYAGGLEGACWSW